MKDQILPLVEGNGQRFSGISVTVQEFIDVGLVGLSLFQELAG